MKMVCKATNKAKGLIVVVVLMELLVLLGWPTKAYSQDVSISASTWSFFPGADGYRPGPAGAYGEIGATLGITPRLETNLGLVGSIAPAPGNTLFLDAAASYSIVGARYISKDEPTPIFSMLLTLGVLEGFHDVWQNDAPSSTSTHATSTHVYMKLTPFGVGSLYYGKRDRGFAVGVQYDLTERKWSIFGNVIASDFLVADLKH
jgi:hypothetical protein